MCASQLTIEEGTLEAEVAALELTSANFDPMLTNGSIWMVMFCEQRSLQ